MTAARLRYQPLARRERVRLWLSYQRYGLLLCGISLAALGAVVVLVPGAPWAWALVALAAFVPFRFGVVVLCRWPRKLRATLIADHRIRAGRFRVDSLRGYAGDPCFRVVAREILCRAAVPPGERGAIIARLRREAEADSNIVMFVDRERGAVVIVDGHGTTQEMTRSTPPARYLTQLD